MLYNKVLDIRFLFATVVLRCLNYILLHAISLLNYLNIFALYCIPHSFACLDCCFF